MRLVPIPEEKYEEYRLRLMFDCYKWDPQFLDHNTVAKYALVITREEYEELKQLTEALDKETRAAEDFLNAHLEDTKTLRLTPKLKKEIHKLECYDASKHVRLMRYDFHPTVEGEWAVSEVNSDVPGGFAEGSLMPQAAIRVLQDDRLSYKNFGNVLVNAIAKKTVPGGRVALVHCTCYSDDRQVMQFLGKQLEEKGFSVVYVAADHLYFENHQAYCLLDGNEGPVDAIVRFTPLEWLAEMKTKHWRGYFETQTTSCNFPIAIYAQSKRFPFVWDILEQNGIDMSTWRTLLPDTIEVKDGKKKEGYIYKPVYGRVGENISIKESCTPEEYKMIMKEVAFLPKTYIAQKRFESKPLQGINKEEYHVCIGSYTIDGAHAGFYARINDTPRIDSNAADIPVLIEGEIELADAAFAKEATLGELSFKTWAPFGKKWVDWVRPVAFIDMTEAKPRNVVTSLSVPENIPLKAEADTAIIVDLYGEDSVEMGLALAKAGYRPIPVYNGVEEQTGARATIDNHSVSMALMLGAKLLAEINIPDDAPPAFLIDKNRLDRLKVNDSIFDNSWDVYPQDLPSAYYLQSQNIKKIMIVSHEISRDLKPILYAWQKKGLAIYLSDGYASPRLVRVRRPLPTK